MAVGGLGDETDDPPQDRLEVRPGADRLDDLVEIRLLVRDAADGGQPAVRPLLPDRPPAASTRSPPSTARGKWFGPSRSQPAAPGRSQAAYVRMRHDPP